MNYYALMILLSFLLNVIVVLFLTRKTKLTIIDKYVLLLLENIGFITGAKIYTYLTHIGEYEFNFLTLGVSSLGAVIGGLLGLILFALITKKSIKFVFNYTFPSIPLMYGVSKIGCLIVGCCYGFKYNGLGKIIYHHSKVAPNNVGLFPVQLLEVISFILLFVFIIYKILKNKPLTLEMIIIFSAILKFILEFFRASHKSQILNINQIICLIFIIISVILIKRKRYRNDL